jgi:hypothetical protein
MLEHPRSCPPPSVRMQLVNVLTFNIERTQCTTQCTTGNYPGGGLSTFRDTIAHVRAGACTLHPSASSCSSASITSPSADAAGSNPCRMGSLQSGWQPHWSLATDGGVCKPRLDSLQHRLRNLSLYLTAMSCASQSAYRTWCCPMPNPTCPARQLQASYRGYQNTNASSFRQGMIARVEPVRAQAAS